MKKVILDSEYHDQLIEILREFEPEIGAQAEESKKGWQHFTPNIQNLDIKLTLNHLKTEGIELTAPVLHMQLSGLTQTEHKMPTGADKLAVIVTAAAVTSPVCCVSKPAITIEAQQVSYEADVLNIGSLAIDTKVYYTVTKTLTQCTISNSTAKVVEGSSYSATITADSGYTLGAVTVTMGGTDISSTAVSGANINIANVTGNIVVTCTATA